MIYSIPLQPVPAQTVTCTLSGRQISLWLRQLSTGVYLDVRMNGQPLIMGALCLNGVDLIRNAASLLPGKLYFTDTQGKEDPYYDGVGERFILNYDDGAV
ncbi:hypothetical protein DTI93_08765 [Parasaccharibacter sp. TMW 2.1884]|uniref:phage baseplate plug family protein n=1 Tax=Parasaccharibacter sp. TMW 2.1884 TaxID=2267834 RepID=UPI00201352A4|nr:hypothetical protein [Parasaccharibacter sp. TMW 2.1884]MCL1512475.1 hypothetical protein [Parasaccharibacter sp. TMW 2.1884]